MAPRRATGILVLFVLAGPGLAGCVTGPADEAPEPVGPQRAVIAAAHPLAAEAGAEMLRRGGNAVDAAAAVQFALNVVEPPMSGLGGGSFIVLWLAQEGHAVVLDGREVAPAAATADQFLTPAGTRQDVATASTQGYAVGVPGTLKVFAHAVEEYGRLGLAATMDPAVRLAEEGFLVDAYLAGYVASPRNQDKLKSWPASAEIFFPGTVCPAREAPLVGRQPLCVYGEALREGDRFVQRDLAATFRLIQAEGPDVFYGGPVAEAVAAATQARDGRMTPQDLADYAIVERQPVVGRYGELTVLSMPPPGGGLIVQHLLQLVEPFGLAGSGPGTVDTLHVLVEAKRLAYADRAAWLADPDFGPVPVAGMLHPGYVAARRALIDPARANAEVGPGDPWRYEDEAAAAPASPWREEGTHTTHFVVVDHEGNVAAVTTTIEAVFGSGMVVPGYGFLLNNQLTDFDFEPGGVNEVAPGKRPRSSMSPTIVLDGDRAVLALGSPGGATIISTVAQVLLNVAEHGMGLEAAVAAPRVYSAAPPTIRWEAGIDAATRDGLRERGHSFESAASRIGNVQAAIMGPDGWWVAVADARAAQGGVVVVEPPA